MPEKIKTIKGSFPEGKGMEQVRTDPVGMFLEQLKIDSGIGETKDGDIDLGYLSPEQGAESMWAIFQKLKSMVAHDKVKVLDFGPRLAILKKLYHDSAVREVYLKASTDYLQEIDAINGGYEKYKALDRQIKESQSAFDTSAQHMFTKRGEGADELDVLLFETNKKQLINNREQLGDLIDSSPELAGVVQHQTLREYSDQLRKENFIWVPSRRAALDEMELAALSGKPLLISGESGTGKTRLVEQASLALTGRINNETPGKDVRFQDLIAKPKISDSGMTYYEYKEIGEAVTGMSSTLDSQIAHDGRVVADDEFNLLPKAEQTERLARIAAWTPGKNIRMPVTNQEITVAPKFLYCAMVNLASERYTREKIPPEVLRKFAKVDLDYPSQTESEPEIYEMMLAALMDENGRIRVGQEELAPYYEEKEEVKSIFKDGQSLKRTVRTREVKNQKQEGNKTLPAGGFLWRLANAIHELNKSFSHKETVLKNKGEAQYLRDLVIDIGTILGWLKEHNTLGRSESLQNFIVSKLNTQFLQKAAYSADDRKLVIDFLKYFGIDTNTPVTAEAKFEILTTLDIGLLSPRVKYEKVIDEEPVLTESYFINENGERIEYYIRPYEDGGTMRTPGEVAFELIGGKKIYRQFVGVTKINGDPVFQSYKTKPKLPSHPETSDLTHDLEAIKNELLPFFMETFKKWNYTQEVKDKFTNNPELKEPKDIPWPSTPNDIDPSKFGEYTLNPDTQDIDWGNIPQEKIKVETMSDMVGKERWQVAQEIIRRYGDKYYIPGIEYYKFLLEHPDQAPNSLKDGNYHYFYGSMFRHSSGRWCVPCVYWDASTSSFVRHGFALDSFWRSNDRVVLVEK